MSKDDKNLIKKLFDAVKNCDLEAVSSMIPAVINCNTESQYDNGTTVLMSASCRDKGAEVMKFLLHGGSKVNAKNREGWTALMLSSRYGLINNVKLLLDSGADKEILNNDGRTALRLASMHDHAKIVTLLSSL